MYVHLSLADISFVMNVQIFPAIIIFILHCSAASSKLPPGLSLNISEQWDTSSSDSTNIPRYMYQKNKFRAGTFFLLIDEQPLVNGTFKKV